MSRGAVGPMAGVISPGTPLLVVEDPVNGTSRLHRSSPTGRGGTSSASAPTGPETLAGLGVDPRRGRAGVPGRARTRRPDRPREPDGAGARHGRRDAHAQRRRHRAPRAAAGRAARRRRRGSRASSQAILRFAHPRQRPVLPRVVDVRGQGGGARASTGSQAPRSCLDDGAQRRRVRHSRRRARRSLVHRARQRRRGPLLSRASAPPTPTATPATPRSWRRTASAAWPWPRRPPCRRSSARSRSRTPSRRHAADGGDLRRRAIRSSRSAPLNGEGTPTGIDIRKVVRTGIVPADQHRHRPPQRAAHDRRRHRHAAARAVRRRAASRSASATDRVTRARRAAHRARCRVREPCWRSFYQDSMVLMQFAATLRALPGRPRGRRAHGHAGQPRAARGGRASRRADSAADAAPGDLMLAVDAETDAAAECGARGGEGVLRRSAGARARRRAAPPAHARVGAPRSCPDANLALDLRARRVRDARGDDRAPARAPRLPLQRQRRPRGRDRAQAAWPSSRRLALHGPRLRHRRT